MRASQSEESPQIFFLFVKKKKKHYFQLQICKGTLVELVNKNMELEMRTGPL